MPRPGPGEKTPGSGRQAGTSNKITVDLKAMIEGALVDAGGRDYLLVQAKENPSVFIHLVSKLIPKEIRAELGVSLAQILMHSSEHAEKK